MKTVAELNVILKRNDLSLAEFQEAINLLAEHRDRDMPAVYKGPCIRFDEDLARSYWQAKLTPADAYREQKNRVLKPFFKRYARQQKVLNAVRSTLKLVLWCCYGVSWPLVWFAVMMSLKPGWGTLAFGTLITGFMVQLHGDEKERNIKVRARLMEIAKAGDRQHMQPMIEAIRKEFD
jgi:hypothetical protein